MRVLVGLLMATAFGWLVVAALRTGQFRSGAKGVIRKNNRPIVYWASIAFGTFLSLTCIAAAFGLLPGQI
jgi:hypothetical protein